MDRIEKRTQHYLPQEIIENILSRLPVKSLVQVKGVCKQWKATISDPRFAEIHLQQTRNSSSSFFVECQEKNAFRRVVIQDEEFKELSPLEYYPPAVKYSGSKVLCHCDGLFLISRDDRRDKISYVLWNPSLRTYKELQYPYAYAELRAGIPYSRLRFGICYDPLLKDYKVVVGDARHYAVFHCRNNSWSEMKEISDSNIVSYDAEGVHHKGFIYWISHSNLENGDHYISRFEIVCFDGRDETFKDITRSLDCRGDSYSLISSGSGLYFFPIYRPFSQRDEVVIMEKVDDAWMEIEVELPFSSFCTKPRCWTAQENKIIFGDFWWEKHLLYDHTKRCFTEIKNSLDLRSRLFPYVQNLFQV